MDSISRTQSFPVPSPLNFSSVNSLQTSVLAPPTPSPSIFGLSTDLLLKPKQDELDMLNATLQLHWAERLGNSQRFKTIAVYLIYWAKEIDELECEPEVLRLGEFFEEVFGYSIHYIKILRSERADLQVLKELSNLLLEYDDEDHLHIVYYAGHGLPITKEGDEIAFVAHTHPAMRVADTLHLQWATIEQTLARAHGHRLCILDCCYSGNIARSVITTAQDHHNFEILSASSYGGTTPGPGDHSFTSALIWALRSLHDEFKEKGFTTTHLRIKIRQAPYFPRDQRPAPVKEINTHARSRIVLHPLTRHHSRTNSQQSANGLLLPLAKPTTDFSIGRYVVNLRFILQEKPTKEKIDELATSMKRCREEVNGICGVGWDGLEKIGSAQKAVVEMFKAKASRRDALKRDYAKPFLALLKSRKTDPEETSSSGRTRQISTLTHLTPQFEKNQHIAEMERWIDSENIIGHQWLAIDSQQPHSDPGSAELPIEEKQSQEPVPTSSPAAESNLSLLSILPHLAILIGFNIIFFASTD